MIEIVLDEITENRIKNAHNVSYISGLKRALREFDDLCGYDETDEDCDVDFCNVNRADFAKIIFKVIKEKEKEMRVND